MPWVDPKGLAEELGISVWTVYRNADAFGGRRFGHLLRFDPDEAKAAWKKREQPAPRRRTRKPRSTSDVPLLSIKKGANTTSKGA